MTVTKAAPARNSLGRNDRARVVAEYKRGKSMRQLAEEFGVSYGQIHKILHEEAVTIRHRGGQKARKK
jgi:transposase-like protein